MVLHRVQVSMLMWTTNSHGLLMILLARPSSSSSSEDAPLPEFAIDGGDHSAVMPGEYPVTSKVSDGDNKNDVELPDGMSGELGESTNANHQPFSYVVLGDDLLASTKPMDGPN